MWTVVLKRTKPCHGVHELPAIHNLAFVGYRYFDSSYASKAVLCSIQCSVLCTVPEFILCSVLSSVRCLTRSRAGKGASLKKGPNRSIFASSKGIPVRYAEAASQSSRTFNNCPCCTVIYKISYRLSSAVLYLAFENWTGLFVDEVTSY